MKIYCISLIKTAVTNSFSTISLRLQFKGWLIFKWWLLFKHPADEHYCAARRTACYVTACYVILLTVSSGYTVNAMTHKGWLLFKLPANIKHSCAVRPTAHCIVLLDPQELVCSGHGTMAVQGVVTILIGMFTMLLQFKGWIPFKVQFLCKEIWY